MFRPFTNVRIKTATALVVSAIFAIVLVYTFPAVHAAPQTPVAAAGQQAPPVGGAPSATAARGTRGGSGGFFSQPAPMDFDDHDGFVPLFDGSTLNGWTSDGTHWSVKDDSIYAQSTCENPTGTIYIYSDIGQVDEFELKVRMKGTGAVNSGVQYRSWLTADMNSPKFPRIGGRGPGAPPAPAVAPGAGATPPAALGAAAGVGGRGSIGPCPSGAPRGTPPGRDLEAKYDMGGPQYDFDNTDMYPGQFYEQSTGRGIIAFPGQVVEADPGKQKRLLAILADADTLKSWFRKDDWNEEIIIARGHTYTHILNGHVASVFIDNDPLYFQSTGHIGFEIESTGEVFIKDIWLKKY